MTVTENQMEPALQCRTFQVKLVISATGGVAVGRSWNWVTRLFGVTELDHAVQQLYYQEDGDIDSFG